VKRIRVLLADDSCVFLYSIEQFLSDEPWIEVVGKAASGLEAVKLEKRLRPDLVLMDWSMPGLNGLEAMRRIKAQANAPRVIMLTGHIEPEYAAAALNDQADGFVNKAEAWFRLLPCIRQLYSEASDGMA
jgi:DNA-binding NarL/FixJ family response regulator